MTVSKRFLLSFGGLFLSFGSPVVAEDWPQYRGPNTNGTTSEALPHTEWPSKGPRAVWNAETNTGFSSFVHGAGHVFTIVRRDFEGKDHETCIALNAETGKEAWAAPLSLIEWNGGGDAGARDNNGGDGPRSTPAFSDGHVYTIDNEIVVRCHDVATGKEKWKRDIIKDHNGRNIKWDNAASPLIVGNHLFLAGGGPGESLLALNKKDGSVVWKQHDHQMTHATPVFAEIHGKRQIIFFTQKGLIGVAELTGDQLWHYSYPYKVSTAASPVVYEDIVFCSAGYGVGGGACKVVKKGDGFDIEEVWRRPNKVINHWSTPVVKDGY
ncbi:MAG: PQQ-binding-like beta-propeller repeat protein, partial [Verrucomicrobiota bacterium]